MKKSDLAGRVADRIGLSQSASGNAVEAVFEAVGEALANGRGSEDRGIRNLRNKKPSGSYRAQPADRREPVDTGLDRAGVQAGQGAQGCRE